MVNILDDGDIRLEHCLQLAADRLSWASLEDHYMRFCSQGKPPELKEELRMILQGLVKGRKEEDKDEKDVAGARRQDEQQGQLKGR